MPSGSLTKILPKSNNEILYLIAAFTLGMFFSHMFLQTKQKKIEGMYNLSEPKSEKKPEKKPEKKKYNTLTDTECSNIDALTADTLKGKNLYSSCCGFYNNLAGYSESRKNICDQALKRRNSKNPESTTIKPVMPWNKGYLESIKKWYQENI